MVFQRVDIAHFVLIQASTIAKVQLAIHKMVRSLCGVH